MNHLNPLEKDPLHERLAGLLENAFNPIMVKELRASMRGSKFFITHVAILSLFATVLLVIIAGWMASSASYNPRYGNRGDPAEIGRNVFAITQLIHLGLVFLVVPGFAAASITSERETGTYDLLFSTTLSASQIIWGKFTAAMTQSITLFVSMIPLVGLCFLFGGVTVYQIVANYSFLLLLSALMISFALSVSANTSTTQRAVGTVYAMSLLAGIIVMAFGLGSIRTPIVGS